MRLTHALAQVAAKTGHLDLAQQLFATNLASITVPGTMWGKSTWALAQLHEKQGQFAQAAQLYWNYGQVAAMPIRLRLFAQVSWARNLIQSGQPDLILAAQQPLLDAINQTQDYELVLDVARQLILAPQELNALAEQVRARGETLANQALNNAEHPAVALSILFKLTRRQNDFGRFTAIVTGWEQLSAENRNWLWTPKGIWWEYLTLVFRAYVKIGR